MSFEAVLMNTTTGERVIVDPESARLNRMRRRVHAWSEAVGEIQRERKVSKKMITLTYAPGVEWRVNHIRDFMRQVRRKLGDELLAYAWVAEMQQRGAVHYHVYLIVGVNGWLPTPDKSGMWVHGLTEVKEGRSPFYLVTYLKKGYQKRGYPKKLRIFAVWINKKFVRLWTWTQFRWSALPAWLRQELMLIGFVLIGIFPKPKDGGGWFINLPPDRAEFVGFHSHYLEFHSPWIMV